MFSLGKRRRSGESGDEPVELAAPADGSLDRRRRVELAVRVDSAPHLAALLAEQEQAAELVRSAASQVELPPALRARLEAALGPDRRPRRRRQAIAFAAAAACVLAVALALAFAGAGSRPSVAAVAALSRQPATDPAPAVSRKHAALLDWSEDGVAFPDWKQVFGWSAAGVRADTVVGRATATVFYAKHASRIAYSIVDGSALRVPRGAIELHRAGTELYAFAVGKRNVVSWLREGRTCVLSGLVARSTLLRLAAWRGDGAVSS